MLSSYFYFILFFVFYDFYFLRMPKISSIYVSNSMLDMEKLRNTSLKLQLEIPVLNRMCILTSQNYDRLYKINSLILLFLFKNLFNFYKINQSQHSKSLINVNYSYIKKSRVFNCNFLQFFNHIRISVIIPLSLINSFLHFIQGFLN